MPQGEFSGFKKEVDHQAIRGEGTTRGEESIPPLVVFDSSVVARYYGGGSLPGAYSLFSSIGAKTLEQLPGRIQNLERAVLNADRKAVVDCAHQLKGTYFMTGSPRLGELCKQIEIQGHLGELETARALLAEVVELNSQYQEALYCYISGIRSEKTEI